MTNTTQTNGGHGHVPGCSCPFCSTTTTAEVTDVDLTIQPRSAPHLPDRTGCSTCGATSIAITAKGTYRKHYRVTADGQPGPCEATGQPVATQPTVTGPGSTTGDHATFFPAAPITPRDVETLTEYKGALADGYDDEKINRVLGRFESARLTCVWSEHDADGYHGHSEIFGVALEGYSPSQGHFATRPIGSYRSLHPDVHEFLYEPDSDLDPETIPSLLADEVTEAGDPDRDMGDLDGDGFHNIAITSRYDEDDDDDDDEEECTWCGESLDDNEGFDGYCGNCADKIENHNQGGHRPVGKTDDEGDDATGPDSDCPNCNGARVTWG